ncbi:MAG: UbiD family decarboxylase [Hyphomicrobiales bacterium]|nr:UbiD family decarboxylase [Hyphomicrobiales bacterium]
MIQPMLDTARTRDDAIDFDRFRLRHFAEHLVTIGEAEVHSGPIAMADLAAAIAATERAILFRDAGPEHFEIVAAVAGSRRRLAAALGVGERDVGKAFLERLGKPQPIIEVGGDVAPVHQVVCTGDAVDLTRLPFHLQHEYDGGVYLSASIDYAVDPATGKRNVGCRRLMLRNRNSLRANLTDESDLKRIYLACLERGERLPVSYVIGSHPLDYLAATQKQPVDEFALAGTVRGEPVPMVRGVTNGILVPADAEAVIEGYFDELGYREMEGPYGEFYGYYGPMHIDPVFHATAITMRRDAMFQTVLHAGRLVGRMDSANLASLNAEVAAWRALRAARIEPVAINFVLASNGRQHCRVALRRGAPGQARLAIAALFALPVVKHVFVVDEDVDVFCDQEVEWAMATRFAADRDIVVSTGMPGFYADPMADKDGLIAKAAFDCTAPHDRPATIGYRRALAPAARPGTLRNQSVAEALQTKAMHFGELVAALGSRDGREIALALDQLRDADRLTRLADGEWALKDRQQ